MKSSDQCQRQFAAAVVLDSLRTMQILLDSRRTKEQYFEGVEALVWFVGEKSERFFEALGFDPQTARSKLDLALYAECALSIYPEMRGSMFRNYIRVVRYDLQRTSELVPFSQVAMYAQNSVFETEEILHHTKVKYAVNGGKVALFLDALSKIEGTADMVRKAG